jgi:4-hydroxybenzoate polyprenyltransferase
MQALIAAGSSVLVGLGLAMTVNSQTLIIACAYVALDAVFMVWLRIVAVADIAVVSGAVAIRAIAGAAATATRPSAPLIAAIPFAALFVAAGNATRICSMAWLLLFVVAS